MLTPMQFAKVIKYRCAQIQSLTLFNSHRTLSTASQLFRHNQPRYREAKVTVNERSKSRRDAARELLIKTNRSKWEKEIAQLELLSGRLPTSNIYLMSQFETKKHSLSEAIELLRESAHPDMYDCMDNTVSVKVTLNMCTKKKTKFINKFEHYIVLPNILTFLPKSRVLAVCQDTDNPEECLNAGAFDAGGSKLIQRLGQGYYHWGEYDSVVAHPSWESHLFKLRHILKEKLPTTKNGKIGEDLVSLCSTYSNGVKLASSSIDGIPEIAFLDLVLGQLSWDVSQLEENLRCYLDCIESEKSNRISGNFIKSGEIHCAPTGERFLLDISLYYTPVSQSRSKSSRSEHDDDDGGEADDEDGNINGVGAKEQTVKESRI
uniref:50S ribosomal protein L1 n=2 Tax=Trichobilharzia regenti TaxID=157069 RepID=A0AA85IU21_TRIRE|nr:unnamed protein product [Trichobilharzia regenti]